MAVVATELYARLGLGLGDPPLSVPHPTIEYMFAPDQDAWPFHNHFATNEYGMRSPTLAGDARRRVLVLGDSVLNGGNLTDHAALATSLLSDDANLYLNASAGSWGPENMLAYLKEFGTFGADHMVLVLSSHDLNDRATFAPLDPNTHPTVRPMSALVEAVQRYLPRYLPFATAPTPAVPDPRGPDTSAIAALVEVAESASMGVCIVMHRTLTERASPDLKGFAMMREVVPTAIDDKEYLTDTDYRDDIHITEAGQRNLARAIEACP